MASNVFCASPRRLSIYRRQVDMLLHPQLPLSQRQSQQLFQLITNSFREHLDAEHGKLSPKSKSQASDRHSSKNVQSASSARQRSSDTASEGTSTDRHMQRLLGNPLFQGRVKSALSRDPMDVFEAAVARGMMDIDNATKCLEAKKRQLAQSSAVDLHGRMRDSKAGSTVLKWLISSGQASKPDFLHYHHRSFCVSLMEFMVAEGLQDVCWTWIRRAFDDYLKALEMPAGPEKVCLKRDLLTTFWAYLKAVTKNAKSFDETYKCLVKAFEYLKHLPVTDLRFAIGGYISLVSGMTKANVRKPSISTASNYNSFLKLIRYTRPNYHADLAHLYLLHPTSPSADLALAVIRQVHTLGPPQAPPCRDAAYEDLQGKDVQADVDKRHIDLALAAAKFLLQHDRRAEADEAMECLWLHYSRQLGLRPRDLHTYEDSKAEAVTLEALDGVSFG